MPIRILLADDFAEWRDFVSSTLSRETDWHIVGESSDGPETVQIAKELAPDLILLDIGLPKYNGIEAARRLRELLPLCKIVFLSGLYDPDIVQEAMRAGASGYIVKSDAAGELTKAIEDILGGKQFLSSRISRLISKDTEDSQTPNGPIPKESRTSSPIAELARNTGTAVCHEVQFYSNDAEVLGRVTYFVGVALMAGNAAIVVATKRLRDPLLRRLKDYGVAVDTAIRRGCFVSLDAAEALSMFMVNDRPEPARFFEGFGKLIAAVSKAASAEHPRVAVFGEGVAVLWSEGNANGAIEVEKLSSELAKIHKVDILCAYPSTLHIQEDSHAFSAICAEHSAVRLE